MIRRAESSGTVPQNRIYTMKLREASKLKTSMLTSFAFLKMLTIQSSIYFYRGIRHSPGLLFVCVVSDLLDKKYLCLLGVERAAACSANSGLCSMALGLVRLFHFSCCSLASQAASPTFRQAIRSSGATNTMFSRLSDAPKSRVSVLLVHVLPVFVSASFFLSPVS